MMANVSDSDYPQNTTPTRENSDHVNAALISDYRNLMAHLREAVTCAKKGSSQEAETQLKLAKGIVNVTDYLEPNAKIYMTAVFAEFHAAILSQSNSVIRGDVTCDDDDSADVMFENYLQSMQFIHGENHVVMSDCYSLVSASRAIKGRYKDAIEVSYCLYLYVSGGILFSSTQLQQQLLYFYCYNSFIAPSLHCFIVLRPCYCYSHRQCWSAAPVHGRFTLQPRLALPLAGRPYIFAETLKTL